MMFDRMHNLSPIHSHSRAMRRGTILVTTMAVCFTLAFVVMILVRTMAVEAKASANTVAAVQAEAIERGAEQYVMSLLNMNGQLVMDPLTFPEEDYFAGIPVGSTGWFWILRPVYDDSNLPLFGLVDECSKLDINIDTTQNATRNAQVVYNQLIMLPGMTEELAAAIIDWQDTDDDSYNGIGAESMVYTSLQPSYYAKNSAFEAVEELLMVAGMYHIALWGDGTYGYLGEYGGNRGGLFSGPNASLDQQLSRGWYDLLTVHSYAPPPQTGGGGGTASGRGLININTAPPAVLYTIPGIEPGDVDSIVAARAQQSGLAGTNDISWVSNAVSTNINNYITGQSYRYSADILAVAANGRAFKRVRIVINAETTPVSIISRRDFTDQGWPMNPQILEQISQGLLAESLRNGSNIGGVFR